MLLNHDQNILKPKGQYMNKSKIEWTDATWNPVRGCTKISPGCDNCYAASFAERFRGVPNHPYEQGFDLRLVPEKLEEPLRWPKPRTVFVNSMSDLFQKEVANEYILRVFDVMNRASWHRYQVLTKRSQRLARVSREIPWREHVWMGVSVESDEYRFRIDHLRETGAYVKFLSLEPLLGPLGELDLRDIDWVIVGGESGAGARPMLEEWATEVRTQCLAAGVPFFMKQAGAVLAKQWGCKEKKGGDIESFPPQLRAREYPQQNALLTPL